MKQILAQDETILRDKNSGEVMAVAAAASSSAAITRYVPPPSVSDVTLSARERLCLKRRAYQAKEEADRLDSHDHKTPLAKALATTAILRITNTAGL